MGVSVGEQTRSGKADAQALVAGRAPALTLPAALSALRAAGEETRLRVLRLLSFGELNVRDLTWILNQSQPRVSRHLKLLDDAGLIRRFREGNWVYCRLAEAGPPADLLWSILDKLPQDAPTFLRDKARLDAVKTEQRDVAQRYFAATAREWDTIRALQIDEEMVEQAMLEAAGPGRFADMLDLGTGTARMLELFAARIGHGVGIDLSRPMLAYARARLERAHLDHCQVRHGDLTNVARDNASVDLVVVHQVLHYFDDPAPIFHEICRVLRPGGRVVIADFAPHDLEVLRHDFAHRRLGFSPDQFQRWAQAAGLEITGMVALGPKRAVGKAGLTVTVWQGVRAQDGSSDDLKGDG
ncbi:MAG: ArsR/SmtB family transcription factor [Alphaproteobacteria bacterium]